MNIPMWDHQIFSVSDFMICSLAVKFRSFFIFDIRCVCPTGWFGVHCTQKTDGCSGGTNQQICGHGICISQPGQGRGFICLCDQVSCNQFILIFDLLHSITHGKYWENVMFGLDFSTVFLF